MYFFHQKNSIWESFLRLTLSACTLVLISTATAAEDHSPKVDPTQVESEISAFTAQLFGEAPHAVTQMGNSDRYEIRHGVDVFYAHYKAGTLMLGSLYEMKTKKDLGSLKTAELVSEKVNDYSWDESLVMGSKDAQRFMTVFTDIDCAFCRKFHRDINELIAHGVSVRYLLFPRAGLDSHSARKAMNAWCAEDRAQAMTRAKRGEPIADLECEAPVAEHYNLGQEIGLRGTPMIILDTGEVINGYLPVATLLARMGVN